MPEGWIRIQETKQEVMKQWEEPLWAEATGCKRGRHGVVSVKRKKKVGG